MRDEAVPSASDPDAALKRMAAYGKKERRSGWGSFFLFLFILISLAAAGWVTWQQLQLQQQVAALRADLAAQRGTSGSERIAQLEQQLQESAAELQEQLQEFDSVLQQQRQEFDAALQQQQEQTGTALQQTVRDELAATRIAASSQTERLLRIESALTELDEKYLEMLQRVNTGADDGGGITPLAEAETLLRAAQQRLLVARDTMTAANLFSAADEVLRAAEIPGVRAVREALAQELAALQAVPTVDVEGLFAQLSAQSALVENFAVAVEGAVQDFALAPTAVETPAVGNWWASAKQTFGEFFVVTHDSADVVPQLGDEERFELRALIQLKIEQAKLALLQGDAQLYRAALDEALTTSQRWLRSSQGQLDEFIAALETLRDTPIVVEIPTTGQALAALRMLSGTSAAPSLPPAAQANAVDSVQ